MNATGEPVTFDSGGLTLEGRLHLPGGASTAAVAVCHPHPLYGGDMNNGVVVSLCRALSTAGMAALRFNFRGVGASEGSHSGGEGERQDLAAALDYLASRGYGRLAVTGYSFGAAVAMGATSDRRVAAVAAVSLPVRSSEVAPEAGASVLLVTGSRDNIAPPEGVRSFGEPLGKRCRLEVIDGADHFWWGHEDRLAETVVGFLREALAGQPP